MNTTTDPPQALAQDALYLEATRRHGRDLARFVSGYERDPARRHRLGPPDREVMLLYLEDLDAASIGEITGLSANNVATKVHRIKKLLALQMNAGESQP